MQSSHSNVSEAANRRFRVLKPFLYVFGAILALGLGYGLFVRLNEQITGRDFSTGEPLAVAAARRAAERQSAQDQARVASEREKAERLRQEAAAERQAAIQRENPLSLQVDAVSCEYTPPPINVRLSHDYGMLRWSAQVKNASTAQIPSNRVRLRGVFTDAAGRRSTTPNREFGALEPGEVESWSARVRVERYDSVPVNCAVETEFKTSIFGSPQTFIRPATMTSLAAPAH